MNEPIINPLLLYLIITLDGIKGLLIMLGFGAVTFTVYEICTWFDEKVKIDALKKARKGLLLCITFATVYTFIPSTKEALVIYTAKNVTPANLKIVGNGADEAVNKIIHIIEFMKKEEHNHE